MLLPRLAALAEAVWSVPGRRNYQNFQERLPAYFDRLANAGFNFRVPPPDVAQTPRIIFTKTSLALQQSVAGSKIVYTMDGSEPSPGSAAYTQPFILSTTTQLKARTLLPNGRMSPVLNLPFYKVQKAVNGLSYRYFEGVWDRLPDFSTLQPVRQGFVYDFDFVAIPAREDRFAIRYQTLVEIPSNGQYTFYLASNDGSKLYINDQLLVDNDGAHSRREKSAAVDLVAGRAAMTIEYFEIGGMQELQVLYEGPGLAKQVLPPDRMFRP
jgi:hypothetical protein